MDFTNVDTLEDEEDLRMEIERLQRELAEVNHKKIQSAEYGLVLLEEKQTLQQKCEEFENLYENAKHELECVKEVIIDYRLFVNHPLFAHNEIEFQM